MEGEKRLEAIEGGLCVIELSSNSMSKGWSKSAKAEKENIGWSQGKTKSRGSKGWRGVLFTTVQGKE